ncbi:MAG: LysR family transcriptional regulator [Cetobacterium sp.]
MNNSDVVAFSEVVKQGSFSKAAEKIFITQSALSSKIKNLEVELDCKLFYRKKGIRYVELTKAGKDFLNLVDRWNKLWFEMSNIKSTVSDISFVVSALNSISTYLLPEVFVNFLERNNKVFLKTEDLSSYASYDAIENRTVDFAIVVDQRYSLNVSCNLLFSEKMVIISANNSTFSDNIDISELNPSKLIYCPWFLEFEQWCQTCFGKSFKPYIQIQIVHQIDFMLTNKDCWCIVPNTVAKMLTKNSNIRVHKTNFNIPKRKVFYLHSIENRYENHIISELIYDLKNELIKLEENEVLECDF